MKIKKENLKKLIENFLLEQEEPEENSDKEKESDKLEDIIGPKSDNEAMAIFIGKLKGGDKIPMPNKIKSIISNLDATPSEKKSEIESDTEVYDEKGFSEKYGILLKFV